MKLSGHVAVTAVGIVVASAGVLSPLASSISRVKASVVTLNETMGPAPQAQAELEILLERIAGIEAASAVRPVTLCTGTPEAASAFETALADQVHAAGLRRVTMVSAPGTPIDGLETLVIDLGVEGSASQVHALLGGIERLPWVSRVLRLELKKGQSVRKVELKIAVPLENAA